MAHQTELASLLARYADAVPLAAHGAATQDRYEDHPPVNETRSACDWTAVDTASALAGCAYDEYLGLKFYHDDPLCRIEQHSLKIGRAKTFVDYEFPTHTAAVLSQQTGTGIRSSCHDHDAARPLPVLAPGIITSSNCRDFLNDGPKRAKRIQHFVKNAATNWVWVRGSSIQNSALFSCSPATSIHPRNLLQGEVGNCGFCAAFASLAAVGPNLIHAAFGAHSERCLHSCGAISVRLYLRAATAAGQQLVVPRYMVLDDHVLCCESDRQSSPSIRSLTNGDLWARLLEKVFVKLQGSYASLDGHYKYNSLYRHPGRALQLLTGAPLAAELNYSKDSIDMVYDVLVQSQELCYARIVHCRQRLHGLHSNHGYSLLWVGQVTTTTAASNSSSTRLVSLRNPHGRGSYTGNYGLGSSVWDSQEGKRVATQLLLLHCFERCPMTGRITWGRGIGGENRGHISTNNADDGIFFMEFDTFVECFPITTVVGPMNTNPGSLYAETSPLLEQPDCVYTINGANLCHVKAILVVAAEQGVS